MSNLYGKGRHVCSKHCMASTLFTNVEHNGPYLKFSAMKGAIDILHVLCRISRQ